MMIINITDDNKYKSWQTVKKSNGDINQAIDLYN